MQHLSSSSKFRPDKRFRNVRQIAEIDISASENSSSVCWISTCEIDGVSRFKNFIYYCSSSSPSFIWRPTAPCLVSTDKLSQYLIHWSVSVEWKIRNFRTVFAFKPRGTHRLSSSAPPSNNYIIINLRRSLVRAFSHFKLSSSVVYLAE